MGGCSFLRRTPDAEEQRPVSASKRTGITAAFRGNCTAFLPRQIMRLELRCLDLPADLAGFPVQLAYRDVRPSLTGSERVFVADYRPQRGSFVVAGMCRKLSYEWPWGGPYHLDVLHDGATGVWSVYKFRSGMQVSHVSARGFGEAMIRATGLGLERDEPAFTYVGDEEACRRENRAQAERARSYQPKEDEAWRVAETVRLPAHQFVFGMVPGSRGASLVFIPAEIARELAEVHAAMRSATWAEFRLRMPAARLKRLVGRMKEHSGWKSFDEYYRDARIAGTRAERERLWQDWSVSDSRPPLDEDPFSVDAIPGYSEGGWPEWPEREMLWWLPREVCNGFGEVVQGAGRREYLALHAGRAPEIIEALEHAGYECVCDEELVRKACGGC
jgi:hypothetical protein